MPAQQPAHRILDPEFRAYARRLVAEAPPLTEAQRHLLAVLFTLPPRRVSTS